MKSFLAILAFLVLCLAFAPFCGAAIKANKTNAAEGNAKTKTEAAASEAIPSSIDKSNNSKKISPKTKKATRPDIEKPEGLNVKVNDGRLSVNVRDQKFGDVIVLIANSAGFDVDLSKDVFDMTLSTRFKETGLQRGILRLLSLIDQKNYSIHYRPDGSIKTLEVRGDMTSGELTLSGARPTTAKTTGKKPRRGSQQMTRPPAPPTVVVPDRKRRRRTSTTPPKEEIEKPVEEEEVMELDYRHFTPLAGQGGGDQGPASEPTPEPTPVPAPEPVPEPASEPAPGDCPDDPACNIIPEGPIPPESDLLNAPVIP